MIGIKPCTYEEVESSGLLELYADECAIDGLPRPAADPEKYKSMIGAGAMKVLGFYQDCILAGFVSVMIIPLPHYKGRCIAATESIFVHPEHRPGGAGIRLLRAAESLADENGAIGLMVSAPAGGALATVLRSLDNYRLTNETFIRGFQ